MERRVTFVPSIQKVIVGRTDGAHQIVYTSADVSSSRQHLVEGAAEQASSLEETSSMTEQNTE